MRYKRKPGSPDLYPYAGSSGWSGTDTSKRRADYADASGLTLRRALRTVKILGDGGTRGWTTSEVCAAFPDSHWGVWSAALSRAHRVGEACLLVEERDGGHIYVLPEFVEEREVLPPQTRRRISKVVRRELTALAEAGDLEGILEYLADEDEDPPATQPCRRWRRVPRT